MQVVRKRGFDFMQGFMQGSQKIELKISCLHAAATTGNRNQNHQDFLVTALYIYRVFPERDMSIERA